MPIRSARRRGGLAVRNRRTSSPITAMAIAMIPIRATSENALAMPGESATRSPLPGHAAAQPESDPPAASCGETRTTTTAGTATASAPAARIARLAVPSRRPDGNARIRASAAR